MGIATPMSVTVIAWLIPSTKRFPLWARNLILIVAGSALLTLSAKISVPLGAVPLTMQTYVVAILAMAYGLRLGAVTVATYLAEGALGLPVFSAGGGLPYMMGPTGGFLAGFLLAAVILGWLADRGWDRSFMTSFAAMALAEVIILFCGVIWLVHILVSAKSLPYSQAFHIALTVGVIPFLYGDFLKILLGTATLPSFWYVAHRWRKS